MLKKTRNYFVCILSTFTIAPALYAAQPQAPIIPLEQARLMPLTEQSQIWIDGDIEFAFDIGGNGKMALYTAGHQTNAVSLVADLVTEWLTLNGASCTITATTGSLITKVQLSKGPKILVNFHRSRMSDHFEYQAEIIDINDQVTDNINYELECDRPLTAAAIESAFNSNFIKVTDIKIEPVPAN